MGIDCFIVADSLNVDSQIRKALVSLKKSANVMAVLEPYIADMEPINWMGENEI